MSFPLSFVSELARETWSSSLSLWVTGWFANKLPHASAPVADLDCCVSASDCALFVGHPLQQVPLHHARVQIRQPNRLLGLSGSFVPPADAIVLAQQPIFLTTFHMIVAVGRRERASFASCADGTSSHLAPLSLALGHWNARPSPDHPPP